MKRQWADKYGSQWYLHYDGHPPHDDENDYFWTGHQWAVEDDNLDLDEFEDDRRRKIAERNEY